MRVYGLVRSERAEKGQGGNKFLDILVSFDKKEPRYRLHFEPMSEDKFYVKIMDMKTGRMVLGEQITV